MGLKPHQGHMIRRFLNTQVTCLQQLQHASYICQGASSASLASLVLSTPTPRQNMPAGLDGGGWVSLLQGPVNARES